MSRRLKANNEESEEKKDEIEEVREETIQEGDRGPRVIRTRVKGEGKASKTIKIIGNILYWILFVATLLILSVVIIQRFSDNTISLGGFRIFNVVTGSMEPEYMIGDVLLSKTKDLNEIEVGDDIVYKGKEGDFADRIVTHRLIEIKEENGERIFLTRGIASLVDEPDPPVSGDQIMGVITYKIQSLSFISKIISNLYHFYFVVFLPLVLLAFIELRKFFKKD